MKVRRLDRAPIAGATKTPEGYLAAPARLTRTGVFDYARADGGIQREIRLEDEVFKPASLESFALKPLTRDHPPVNLDATNARAYQVGIVQNPRREGDHVAGEVMIYDAETVRAVEAGTRELSCGYECNLEPVPGGVHKLADGTELRGDFYQRNIIGNHVAIVDKGRAGPSAAIRLDSAGNAIGDGQRSDMKKIKIGDTEHEVADAVADAFAAFEEKLTKAKEAAKEASKEGEEKEKKGDAALAAMRAERDKAAGERDATKAKLDAADSDAKRRADAANQAARLKLVALGATILGKKLDEAVTLDDDAIRRAVLAKEAPGVKLDGQTADYVRAAFDLHVAGRADSSADLARAVLDAKGAPAPDVRTDAEKKLDEARAKARDSFFGAWKTPTTAAASK